MAKLETRDPIGYGDGPNVYLSVHNNPINHIDPLGLGMWDWMITGEWNPSDEARRAAEQGLRECNVASQVVAGVAKTGTNVVGHAVDIGMGVGYLAATGERMDAALMEREAYGDFAKQQAGRIAAGKYTGGDMAKDAGLAVAASNPITGPAIAGWNVGTGIREGDFVKVGEGGAHFASLVAGYSGKSSQMGDLSWGKLKTEMTTMPTFKGWFSKMFGKGPALSEADWQNQGRPPEQSSPYDIRERRASDGSREYTTYDEYGNRHRQYNFESTRHGEHQHTYDQESGPRPYGDRSDAQPIED